MLATFSDIDFRAAVSNYIATHIRERHIFYGEVNGVKWIVAKLFETGLHSQNNSIVFEVTITSNQEVAYFIFDKGCCFVCVKNNIVDLYCFFINNEKLFSDGQC